MCPTDVEEVTPEEEAEIIAEAEKDSVVLEEEVKGKGDEQGDFEEEDIEKAFEGVDKVEDIPKGKEKKYGI